MVVVRVCRKLRFPDVFGGSIANIGGPCPPYGGRRRVGRALPANERLLKEDGGGTL